MWHLPVDGIPYQYTHKCAHPDTVSIPVRNTVSVADGFSDHGTDSNANRLADSDSDICANICADCVPIRDAKRCANRVSICDAKRCANKAAIGGALCITDFTTNIFANSTTLGFANLSANAVTHCDPDAKSDSVTVSITDTVAHNGSYVGIMSWRVGPYGMHICCLQCRCGQNCMPWYVWHVLQLSRIDTRPIVLSFSLECIPVLCWRCQHFVSWQMQQLPFTQPNYVTDGATHKFSLGSTECGANSSADSDTNDGAIGITICASFLVTNEHTDSNTHCVSDCVAFSGTHDCAVCITY